MLLNYRQTLLNYRQVPTPYHIVAWRYPTANLVLSKNTDFLAVTFANCFDHNFVYICPIELTLFAWDSTLKKI